MRRNDAIGRCGIMKTKMIQERTDGRNLQGGASFRQVVPPTQILLREPKGSLCRALSYLRPQCESSKQ